jgi:hypothetical protein
MYTKRQFANELRLRLEAEPTISEVSNWAHHVYMVKGREFEPGLLPAVMSLIAMNEGPEFLYTYTELRNLACELSKS